MARLLIDTPLGEVYLTGACGTKERRTIVRHRKRRKGAKYIVFPNLPDGLFYHLYSDPSEPWKTCEVHFEGDNTTVFRQWSGKTDVTIVAKHFSRS